MAALIGPVTLDHLLAPASLRSCLGHCSLIPSFSASSTPSHMEIHCVTTSDRTLAAESVPASNYSAMALVLHWPCRPKAAWPACRPRSTMEVGAAPMAPTPKEGEGHKFVLNSLEAFSE